MGVTPEFVVLGMPSLQELSNFTKAQNESAYLGPKPTPIAPHAAGIYGSSFQSQSTHLDALILSEPRIFGSVATNAIAVDAYSVPIMRVRPFHEFPRMGIISLETSRAEPGLFLLMGTEVAVGVPERLDVTD